MESTVDINSSAWTKYFTIASIIFFFAHLYFILGLAFMFGASLESWAAIVVFLGPPLTLIAVIVSVYRPINRKSFITNSVILSIYLLYWISMLPKLSWEG